MRCFGSMCGLDSQDLAGTHVLARVDLTRPLFDFFDHPVSWRDIILVAGGFYLIYKGTIEIHQRLEGDEPHEAPSQEQLSFGGVIIQIILLDVVFSLDSRGRGGHRLGLAYRTCGTFSSDPSPQALLIIQIWRALRRSAVILPLVCSALLAADRLTHCKDERLSARKAFAAFAAKFSALLAADRLTHCKDERLSARKAFAAFAAKFPGGLFGLHDLMIG